MDESTPLQPTDLTPGYGAERELPVEPVKDTEAASTIAPTPSNVSAVLQALTDRALDFLSHASNEALGATLVGLGATTYMLLGRVGLVIIGFAGGVVLHATWAGIRGDDRDDATKKAELEQRQQTSVELAKRLLRWRQVSHEADGDLREAALVASTARALDFSTVPPLTAAAFTTFADAVIKDYVHYWYDPTIPEEKSFPTASRATLTGFILSLSSHLSRKRPADLLLDFLTNTSSILLVFLSELSTAINAFPHADSSHQAVEHYLRMKPDCSLSYLLDPDAQASKLDDAAEDILQAFLDRKVLQCEPVRVFLKQVMAKLVLGYTVTYCGRAEFLNEWIVYGLEESATVEGVMGAVNAGVDAEGKASKAGEKLTDAVSKEEPSLAAVVAEEARERAERPKLEHKRQASRAEDAMDEAMAEAKRLTQLMIEEDEKRARDEQVKRSSEEDVSTQGAITPTSSQSDREAQEDESNVWASRGDSLASTQPTLSSNERPTTPTSHRRDVVATHQQFTSFDQLLPVGEGETPHPPGAFSPERTLSPQRTRPIEPLTLHNATISIFDDSQPSDRSMMKNKPSADYLIQIEPANSAFPGWMIARKYTDFETLHEVLRRISVITGAPLFNSNHPYLAGWKGVTKPALRQELETYLTDAVRFQSLAESEGMKRFLEKDQGLARSAGEGTKVNPFAWAKPEAFGKLGGDFVGALAKAPKNAVGGGKAVFGGVAGVLGVKRAGQAQGRNAVSPANSDTMGISAAGRQSTDSLRSMPTPSFERQRSHIGGVDAKPRPSVSSQHSRNMSSASASVESLAESSHSERSGFVEELTHVPGLEAGMELLGMRLPPRPSELDDEEERPHTPAGRQSVEELLRVSSNSDQEEAHPATPPRLPKAIDTTSAPSASVPPTPSTTKPASSPLTERETSVAVELCFAIISELYTLSSAWNIRRTLLLAAKNFLLRPGNPQLLSIRSMLQSSALDANTSDSGIAAHIYKLRESALPTAEETKKWEEEFPPRTDAQKEELRIKARDLLVRTGMPVALQSVMGAAASGEALGRVFDVLQDEKVGRGVVFGVLLQGVKGMVH